ncbi:DUF742 domain-containing protein [Streptomyces sp. 6N223]|uniref:DUF742 domain-containing protein n=1 Tax=Streptomyces sp. 6N223 TaxID=3457412 RepID=UPI003FCFB36D
MSRPARDEDPDRLYTLTGGRSRAGSNVFDLVTLVVSESEPAPGMQSEHARILRLCRYPTAVVEVAAELRLPVSITKILLSDLLDSGRITARHPNTTRGTGRATTLGAAAADLPDPQLLEQVLVGLRNL